MNKRSWDIFWYSKNWKVARMYVCLCIVAIPLIIIGGVIQENNKARDRDVANKQRSGFYSSLYEGDSGAKQTIEYIHNLEIQRGHIAANKTALRGIATSFVKTYQGELQLLKHAKERGASPEELDKIKQRMLYLEQETIRSANEVTGPRLVRGSKRKVYIE